MLDKKKINNKNKEHNIDEWTIYHEQLLSNWGDKANCYVWLHDKSHILYKKRNIYFSIPIIILSAISGTANYGITSIFPNLVYGNIIIGTIGLIVAIISFINNFYRHAELSESHRISSLSWNKFHRNLTLELSLQRSERLNVNNLLLFCQNDMDRLIEQSPVIPECILLLFKKKFLKKLNCELPTELDNINPIYIYNKNYDFKYHHTFYKLFNTSTDPIIINNLAKNKLFNINLINNDKNTIELHNKNNIDLHDKNTIELNDKNTIELNDIELNDKNNIDLNNNNNIDLNNNNNIDLNNIIKYNLNKSNKYNNIYKNKDMIINYNDYETN